MKKSVSILLYIIACVVLLSSCEKGPEHTYGEWQYDEVNHWRDYTCECEHEQESEPHIFDSNGKCTACGFEAFKTYQLTVIDEGRWLVHEREDVYEEFDVIKFHTFVHPIRIDMYVDGEFYSSGKQVSINENADYIEYRFVMPNRPVTVEFKTDLVSYSSFLMLNTWLGRIQYNEVDELVIEKGAIGVGEPEVITYTYSRTISAIKEALIDMKICEVRKDSELAAPVEGGEYIKYTFVTEAQSYTIYVENSRMEIDGKIYLVYGDYPLE